MSHTEGSLPGSKGLKIHWQNWAPDTAPVKAAVIIAHGLGEHGGRYGHVAEALVAQGCSVYAIDHRGHGRSEGARAMIDRFAHAVADLDLLATMVQREHRGKPLFLLGHSLGGALSLSFSLKHADKLDGLILSGPAVALDGAPPMMKPLSKLLSFLTPKVGMFGIDPSLVNNNPETAVAYAKDPLNCHGKVPARTLGELVKFLEWMPAVLPFIKLPTLILHGRDDRLAGVAGSEMLLSRLGSFDKTLKIYDGLGHEIFNERPEQRAAVLDDLSAWLQERTNSRKLRRA
jgi:acylglycerol lipase